METSKEIEDLLKVVQLGDMIEFIRGVYSHWGIYIGENRVIHRWGENDGIGHSIGLRGNVTTIFVVQFNKAKIMKTELSLVLEYGGKVRVNNYLDSKKKPLSVQVILDRANSAVDREGYNLIYGNCEHFVTDCRYGQPTSRQVQTAVVGSLVTGIFITAVAAVGAYFVRSSQEKEEREENQPKIKMLN